MGAPHERVDAGRSPGRIAAEIVAPYPPGVPVLVPGERITRHVIDGLQAQMGAGVRMSGPSDSSLQTILVVA